MFEEFGQWVQSNMFFLDYAPVIFTSALDARAWRERQPVTFLVAFSPRGSPRAQQVLPAVTGDTGSSSHS